MPDLATPGPNSLASLVSQKFEAAKASGALVFTPSTSSTETVHGIQYLYTLAPALNKKPNAVKSEDAAPKLLGSPWTSPEPKLTVLDDFEDDYRIVLNKFAIVKDHILVVTKKQVSQSAALTPADLAATSKALKLLNESSNGKRHAAFYNSGPHSGASIDHKHIQIVPLPPTSEFEPFVDQIVALNPGFTDLQRPLTDQRPAFAHYIAPITESTDKDHLGMRYSGVMSRVMTVLRNNEVVPKEASHNFVMTERWMIAAPRSKSSVDGRGFNSLGIIGMLLAKSEEDLAYFKEKGPGNILADLGYEPVAYETKEDTHDY